jgi:hypothetical protein
VFETITRVKITRATLSTHSPFLQRGQLGQEIVVAVVVKHRETVPRGASGDQTVHRGAYGQAHPGGMPAG